MKTCNVEGCDRKHYAKGLCSKHYYQKYHGKELSSFNSRERIKKPKDKKCSVLDCEEEYYAKSFCKYHYFSKYNSEGGRYEYLKGVRKKYFRTEKGKAALKKSSQKRRARKKGSITKDFSNKDIFERDNYVCSICALPIDKSLTHPNPNSITLEHILPLSKGGSHSPENVTCAHWICNIRRGNRPLKNNFEGASI